MNKINTTHMKFIATFFMLIDHIAFTLLPTDTTIYLIMRCIGRIAAPLFWFAFIEGYRHTSNRKQYFLRLFTFGLIMGVFNVFLRYLYQINITFWGPNTFLTLSAMLLFLEIYQSYSKEDGSSAMILKTLALIGLGYLLIEYLEYGAYIFLIAPLLYFINDKMLKVLAYCTASIFLCIIQLNMVQMTMIVSGLFFLFYSDEKPTKSYKWFFYVFYPLHLWLLLTIRYLFV